MKEFWKDVPGHDDLYEASNTGRIKRKKTGRILSQRLEPMGYLRVKMFNKNNVPSDYRVHRIIALTFITKNQKKNNVNHIDGNKINNNVSNLEWVTRSENTKHAYRTGLANKQGENHHNAILSEKDVLNIRRLYGNGVSQADLHRKYSLNRTTISDIVRHLAWQHI